MTSGISYQIRKQGTVMYVSEMTISRIDNVTGLVSYLEINQ